MKKEVKKLKSWEEVDNNLKRLGEIQIMLGKLNGEMTLKINEIKEYYKEKSEIYLSEQDDIEKSITDFCENCKDEFIKVRSKVLNFGTVAYRVTEKIIIKSKEACIAALKALNMPQYIRIIEEPNKDMLRELEDKMLAKVAASRKIDDSLRIEPNLEKIQEV